MDDDDDIDDEDQEDPYDQIDEHGNPTKGEFWEAYREWNALNTAAGQRMEQQGGGRKGPRKQKRYYR